MIGLALFATGCASGASSGEGEIQLTVAAASSLTEVMPALAEAFATEHPNVDIEFSFGSSSDLAVQVIEGAPFDVFASADDTNMQKIVDVGENDGAPLQFATNTFAILVSTGNPLGITSVKDLANPDLTVITCAITAPCGKGAAEIFQNAGVTVTPKSFEEKVKGVVTKVLAGEADAGVVYITDVRAVGDAAQGIRIPAEINVVNKYPIVATRTSKHKELAQLFVNFVASTTGQRILSEFGFGTVR